MTDIPKESNSISFYRFSYPIGQFTLLQKISIYISNYFLLIKTVKHLGHLAK